LAGPIKPASTRSRVVLPTPFEPPIQVSVPGSRVRSRSSITRLPGLRPHILVMFQACKGSGTGCIAVGLWPQTGCPGEVAAAAQPAGCAGPSSSAPRRHPRDRIPSGDDGNMCSMPDPPPARRSDDTHVIANTLSPQGRKVELTERKWAYVQHHVEMRGELELLLAAIRQPDLQEPDPHPGRERYWLRTQPPFRVSMAEGGSTV